MHCTFHTASESVLVRKMSGLTRDGTGRPNLSRETNFSGANGDKRNIHFFCSSDHQQARLVIIPVDARDLLLYM